MKALYCDVCRKALSNPISNRNYWHIGTRDICEPCKDGLEVVLKPVVRAKTPFNYEWYLKLITDSIEKAIQKGRF